MIALGLGACTSSFPEELLGVRVKEAHLEAVTGGGMVMIGGGWAGSGDLVGTTVAGEEVRVPVDLAAGSVGLLMDMSFSLPSKMRFGLPDPDVPAGDLFGRYKGSHESLILLAGASAVHLENPHGVRIDDVGFAMGVGIEVGWYWMNVTMHTEHDGPDPHSGHTGATGDSGTTDTGTE